MRPEDVDKLCDQLVRMSDNHLSSLANIARMDADRGKQNISVSMAELFALIGEVREYRAAKRDAR